MSTPNTTALALGATGRAVTFLQARLGVPQSGTFDAGTATALKQWQAAHNLTSDGVYGPLTNAAMTARSDEDLRTTALSLDVELAALRAVLTVETSGSGFLPNGLPKILLERHYVYRLATDAARAKLPPSVCSTAPGGYVGGAGEWARFEQVAAVDLDLAIQSCSWGLPQAMGAYWQTMRYTSPDALMASVARNERTQLVLLDQYLTYVNRNALRALQNKDFDQFAAAYNGPANVAVYGAKLRAAYAAACAS